MHILWQDLIDARSAALDPVKQVWIDHINAELLAAASDLTVNVVTFNVSGDLRSLPGGEPGSAYVNATIDAVIADAAAAGFPSGNPAYNPSSGNLNYTLPAAADL